MTNRLLIAMMAGLLFAGTVYAAPIVTFTAVVDPGNNSFDVFVENMAPRGDGNNGTNGGISAFSITFTPNVDMLDPARLSGTSGTNGLATGFRQLGTGGIINPDPVNDPNFVPRPNLFGGQEGNNFVFGFGQGPGQIDHLFIPGSTLFDGPIPFDKPALIGHGTFTGDVADFGIAKAGANIFMVDGDPTATALLEDEVDMMVIIPEPVSAAMLGACGLFLLPRRRRLA